MKLSTRKYYGKNGVEKINGYSANIPRVAATEAFGEGHEEDKLKIVVEKGKIILELLDK